MDNPATLSTQYSQAKYRHRILKRSVTQTHTNRIWAQMLAKGKYFLSLIRHPICYSYSQRRKVQYWFCFLFYLDFLRFFLLLFLFVVWLSFLCCLFVCFFVFFWGVICIMYLSAMLNIYGQILARQYTVQFDWQHHITVVAYN
jgi:hypothetical protein